MSKKKPKFEKDVIICSDDGHIYHLEPEDLEKFEVSEKDQEKKNYQYIHEMLKTGVSSAAIPPTVNKDGQAMFLPTCYVLNLASFKKHTVYED